MGPTRTTKRVETVSKDSRLKFEPHDGKALRIRVDQGGHYGVSLDYRFAKRTGSEPEEVFFRYYLRLADDWRPQRGGKLPGIGGTYGRAGWGGRKVDGTNGWSAQGLFNGQKNAEINQYGCQLNTVTERLTVPSLDKPKRQKDSSA